MKSYFGLVGAFLFALTAEAAVPRLLNGGRADFDYVVEGYGGTSVTTWAPHGVRDMGGYIGKDGRRARQGLVVRNSAFDPSAASLVLADDAGLEVVEVGVPPTLDVGEATATPGTDFVGARGIG